MLWRSWVRNPARHTMGHFSHIIVIKIVMFVWKDENKRKRGRRWWLFLKKVLKDGWGRPTVEHHSPIFISFGLIESSMEWIAEWRCFRTFAATLFNLTVKMNSFVMGPFIQSSDLKIFPYCRPLTIPNGPSLWPLVKLWIKQCHKDKT